LRGPTTELWWVNRVRLLEQSLATAQANEARLEGEVAALREQLAREAGYREQRDEARAERDRLLASLDAAKAKVTRVLIAAGPHLSLWMREELESITGERLFFGGRDERATKPAGPRD
jgi:DNA repair exonuclease SbcCD ATPase subunit